MISNSTDFAARPDYHAVGECGRQVRAVVDAGIREVLGCAALGFEGGEPMAALEVHGRSRALHDPARSDFAHPTLAESLNELFATT